jgi:hypothetical protein
MKLPNGQQFILIIIGVCSIVILEIIALIKNIDGILFSAAIGGICSLIAYGFGRFKNESKDR